jgi:hypothetical protein
MKELKFVKDNVITFALTYEEKHEKTVQYPVSVLPLVNRKQEYCLLSMCTGNKVVS